MEEQLKFYSNSPHVKGRRTTREIMLNVCIALLPALVMGVRVLRLARADDPRAFGRNPPAFRKSFSFSSAENLSNRS